MNVLGSVVHIDRQTKAVLCMLAAGLDKELCLWWCIGMNVRSLMANHIFWLEE